MLERRDLERLSGDVAAVLDEEHQADNRLSDDTMRSIGRIAMESDWALDARESVSRLVQAVRFRFKYERDSDPKRIEFLIEKLSKSYRGNYFTKESALEIIAVITGTEWEEGVRTKIKPILTLAIDRLKGLSAEKNDLPKG